MCLCRLFRCGSVRADRSTQALIQEQKLKTLVRSSLRWRTLAHHCVARGLLTLGLVIKRLSSQVGLCCMCMGTREIGASRIMWVSSRARVRFCLLRIAKRVWRCQHCGCFRSYSMQDKRELIAAAVLLPPALGPSAVRNSKLTHLLSDSLTGNCRKLRLDDMSAFEPKNTQDTGPSWWPASLRLRRLWLVPRSFLIACCQAAATDPSPLAMHAATQISNRFRPTESFR